MGGTVHIYIINSLVCLFVCLFVPCCRLNGWADFKTFLHVDYPWVGNGFKPKIFLIGRKKKIFFFSDEKFFFRNFFDFFKFFPFFRKFQNSPKKFNVKIFLEKKLGKANLQLSERSEPRIPRVYRVPKAPSMRVYLISHL